jgi:hypothetical protein
MNMKYGSETGLDGGGISRLERVELVGVLALSGHWPITNRACHSSCTLAARAFTRTFRALFYIPLHTSTYLSSAILVALLSQLFSHL